MKTTLGTKVGLIPGHTVLVVDQLPPKEHAPNFRPMSILANGRPSQLRTCLYFIGLPEHSINACSKLVHHQSNNLCWLNLSNTNFTDYT